MQLVYPEEALQRVPKELLSHANMTTYSYQVPQSELELREAIRDPKRKTGMKTKAQEEQFGLPQHTQAMLTDTHLHKILQVCCPVHLCHAVSPHVVSQLRCMLAAACACISEDTHYI